MNRIRQILLCVLCALAVQTSAAKPHSDGTERSPNVVLIYIDDLGYGDLGSYGCTDIPTPNIDRLAAEGVRFKASYIPNPPCCPSRCSLMMGQYAQRFGKYGMSRGLAIPEDRPTLARFLRDAGYVTGQIGKWDIGTKLQGPLQVGFMEVAKIPPKKIYTRQELARLPKNQRTPSRNSKYFCINEAGETMWLTDYNGDSMVDFIKRHQDEPFFLYWSPEAVHSPSIEAPERLMERTQAKGKRRKLAGAIVAVDDQVGKLLDVLNRHGLRKNTLVIFSSDNGANGGEGGSSTPYTGGKGQGTQKEGWVRVPTIFSMPGILPEGKHYEGLIANFDFYSTIAALAGQPIPKHCDGVDLFPYLRGERAGDAHEYLFWLNNQPDDAVRRHLIAVRWKDWRLHKKYEQDPWQLFDLKLDPREENDIASKHPDIVKQMAAKHAAWSQTLAPLGKIPEIRVGAPIVPTGHGWAYAKSHRTATSTKHTLAKTEFKDTFTPYRQADEVSRNVVDLWKDYDARKEALDVRIVKEWKTNGVVTRYVTFKVGTFKGADARIAAYYSFPDNGRKNPAFVWSHGGGQRAERNRGVYFARQGFATVDINWLGRPMEEGVEVNTDWGKVDPTQGPRFYSRALRKGWKRNLQPDEHSIDPVPSPRNANWFLLTVAARRAITFLEHQPEVDAGKLGFAGFSMGGMITALVAIDPRLKAVAPFVGGTGFKYVDFPGGIQGSSIREHFQHLELYKSTIDASAYWPLVRCPVVFISSSNDSHSTFERIYRSMALLKHRNWRVTCNIHQNHGPGPEQWAVLNLWFNQYLKGLDQDIPVTPPSTLRVTGQAARFTVEPADQDRLVATEIYYSHDPNSRTRFWNRADATRSGKTWQVDITVHGDLPLYVFAICRYRLPQTMSLERGETSTFTLNSIEHVIVPETVDLKALAKLKKTGTVFEDFRNGIQDWSSRDGRTIRTYKFQSPNLDRSNNKQLALTIDPKGRRLSLQLNAGSRFLSRENNLGNFTFVKRLQGEGARVIRIGRNEFKSPDGKTLEWSKIATFDVSIVDEATKAKLDLTATEGREVLQLIQLVDAR